MSLDDWALAAKASLTNAKRELVYAANAFDKAGGFELTIKEIKENIGDLEIALQNLIDNEGL